MHVIMFKFNMNIGIISNWLLRNNNNHLHEIHDIINEIISKKSSLKKEIGTYGQICQQNCFIVMHYFNAKTNFTNNINL